MSITISIVLQGEGELPFVEADDNLCSNGEQEVVLGTVSSQRLHDRQEEEPLEELYCIRSSCGFLALMMKLFQIAGTSSSATKWFKIFARKVRPLWHRGRRRSSVSPSCSWAVEQLAFLMVAATPLSSNSRK